MISKHVDSAPNPEHRITIDMTVLEAFLFLRDQPVVLREVRRRVRLGLSGCDDCPKGEGVL